MMRFRNFQGLQTIFMVAVALLSSKAFASKDFFCLPFAGASGSPHSQLAGLKHDAIPTQIIGVMSKACGEGKEVHEDICMVKATCVFLDDRLQGMIRAHSGAKGPLTPDAVISFQRVYGLQGMPTDLYCRPLAEKPGDEGVLRCPPPSACEKDFVHSTFRAGIIDPTLMAAELENPFSSDGFIRTITPTKAGKAD